MTDWYFGHGVGDFVAQKDQEYFDRLPSPDSWSQWETCGIGGNSGWANSYDSGIPCLKMMSSHYNLSTSQCHLIVIQRTN